MDEDEISSAEYKSCKICSVAQRNFYCQNCVQTGDFVHSSKQDSSERFADKQLRYHNLKANLRKCNEQCIKLLQQKKLFENIRTEVKRKRDKTTLLRRLIHETKASLDEKTKSRDELLTNNRLRQTILPKYEDKVKKLEDYVSDRAQQNTQLADKKLDLLNQTKQTIRTDAQRLITYIFPISQTHPKPEQPDPTEILDTVSALADATRTSYIRGRWVYQDSCNSEIQHTIVAPSLPANGDYIAYSDWVTHNKDGLPASASSSETLPSMNPAYRISAALTYTTQLINLLSFYLDIRLPYKLAYGDFCKKEMSEQQFSRKVARLNANILYLCYTQRVKLTLLNPSHTLENLSYILNNTGASDLGRVGPVDVSDAPLNRSEEFQTIRDLEPTTDTESDDDNSFRQEWESVPHLSSVLVNSPLPTSNPQAAASMAGGLVTSAAASIASIFRGWTTGGR